MDYGYLDQVESKNSFLVSSSPEAMDFYLEGLKCSRCISKVEKSSQGLADVADISTNFGSHVSRVTLKSGGSFSLVAKNFEELGHKPHPLTASSQSDHLQKLENKKLLTRVAVGGAVSGNIMLFSVSNYVGATQQWAYLFDVISGFLFLGILFFASFPFYENVVASVKRRSASIDIPIVFSVITGAAISYYHLAIKSGDVYFDSLAMLVFLILGSRYILSLYQQKFLSPSLFKDFFNMIPVLLEKNGEWSKVLPSEILPGNKIKLSVGDVLPVDAIVLSDDFWVDNSVITGESLPRRAEASSVCRAGAKLVSELGELKAVSTMRGSKLGMLISKVEGQLLSKTPLSSVTDKVAQYFTYSVVAIAVVFFAFYASIDLAEAFSRTLALIVLACPCALAFATPLSQSVALAKLAKQGVFVKNAEALEKLFNVKSIIFDKTGTLSKGELEFDSWVDGVVADNEKSIIVALEQKSNHPLAKSLRIKYSSYENKSLHIVKLKETVAVGVSGYFEDDFYEIKPPPSAIDKGALPCLSFYKNNQYIATAYFKDICQDDTASTLRRLKNKGYESFIISGDHKTAVHTFAKKLEVSPENVLSDMSPEDKEQFLENHPGSVMVGDGANDLLALSKGHVSVAVKGSLEVSLKVADVYMTKEGVVGVAELLTVARSTINLIKRNLGFSLIYNVIGITAALLGYVSPVVAAILMPVSSLIVIFSTLVGSYNLKELLLSEVKT